MQPALGGLAFLLGSWTSGAGKVADTGGTSQGTSVITADAGGAMLLRRDHVDLFDKAGKQAGGFDCVMTIYAEHNSVHADYFDGDHVIHYRTSVISPGKSVTFATGASAGEPEFRLRYSLSGDVLAVAFGVVPPGQASVHPIADGVLHRH